MTKKYIPSTAYGVSKRNSLDFRLSDVVEGIRNLGFSVLRSKFSSADIKKISSEFDCLRQRYIEKYSETLLRDSDEYYTIRAPLTFGERIFIELALYEDVLSVVSELIDGKFILNQQNGITNPSQSEYNQGAWHRDLPYQHFVSSRPLAVNALFCLDDFTSENGATYVLPASHLSENFPSIEYVKNNALQIEAPAGSFIILDCMLFHSGGYNRTDTARRAVNHVFTIPYFKQQINFRRIMSDVDLSDEEKQLLGFNYLEARSIAEYIEKRKP